MNTRSVLVLLAVAVACAAAGAWLSQFLARSPSLHRHVLEPRTSAEGGVYYTCAKHPQVRLDAPGACPICGMTLSRRTEGPDDPATADGDQPQILYWYDPMRPDQHFDAPGPSPFMDMALVPKYADASATTATTLVQIDPRMAQNLGMRTVPARLATLEPQIRAVGQVVLDERRIVTVQTRTTGWIEHLDVRAQGDPVRKGQRLAAIYSPQLHAARQELALAEASGDEALAQASRQRLRLLGGRRAPGTLSAVIAPASGFVMRLDARQGEQLAPGQTLMTLADLSQVWVLLQIPEARSAGVHAGQTAVARLRSLPGRSFAGRVDYLYPQLDPDTRTVQARLVFDNPDSELRPGMFAEVSLNAEARREVLQVPTEAVIRTGTRTVVMVAERQGRYRPVHVQTGVEHDGWTQILSGLQAGQQVVVSGQFLIDSEASLLGAYRRLEPTPAEAPAANGTSDGPHGDRDGRAEVMILPAAGPAIGPAAGAAP